MPSKKTTEKKPSAKASTKPAGRGPAKTTGKPVAVAVKGAAKPKETLRDGTIRKAMKPKTTPAAKPKAPKESTEVIDPVATTERRNKGTGVRGKIAELIAEQKWTDKEILAKVQKAIPGRQVNVNIIGACRSEMNFGTRKVEGWQEGIRYEQIVSVDGKNIPKSERPPKEGMPRPRKRKVDPENDPLKKIGIAPVKRSPKRKVESPIAAE